MAPSRHSILALLGLFASARAVPAGLPFRVLPTPSNEIGLNPPSQSVSWDLGLPTPSEVPEESEQPIIPPKPTDQISLSPPSYSVSWDPTGPTEAPIESEYPSLPPVKPSNQISLSPSYSVSWDPGYPGPTEEPQPEDPEESGYPPPPPKPSDQISLSPPSASVTWDLGYPIPTKQPWFPFPPKPKPSDQISLGKPTASVSWDKRQIIYEPEPTELPEFPNEPEEPEDPQYPGDPDDPEDPGNGGPIIIPPFPVPTPPNSIGIQPPTVSFSWGKRQIQDEPEPTEEPMPEDPEDPGEGPINIPPFPVPTPPNSIGIQPPHVSFSWGKREAEPATNTIGLQFPTFSFNWPRPVRSSAYISWGKRQDNEGPTDISIPPAPTPSNEISIQPPQVSFSWGKREAEPQTNTVGLIWPSNIPKPSWDFPLPPVPPQSGYFSWGKRDAPPKPTSVSAVPPFSPTITPTPIPPTPPSMSGACPTVTQTIIPPCVPPSCPSKATPCDLNRPVPVMEKKVKQREIEKTIVTIVPITTVHKPTVVPLPTPTKTSDGGPCADAVTKTVYGTCPTYTCVPWCNPVQVVR